MTEQQLIIVYVLRSLKDKNFYTGMSEDAEKRLKEHNSGRTKSIKHRIPFELIYTEKVHGREEARKRERYFKSAAGRRWIKKYIENKKTITIFNRHPSSAIAQW